MPDASDCSRPLILIPAQRPPRLSLSLSLSLKDAGMPAKLSLKTPSATQCSEKNIRYKHVQEREQLRSRKMIHVHVHICVGILRYEAAPVSPVPGLNSRKMLRYKHVQSHPAIHILKLHCFKVRFTPIRQLSLV